MIEDFVIKCVTCKDDFVQDKPNTRKCGGCITQERYKIRKYNILKRKIAIPETYERKCIFCATSFRAKTPIKKYCSSTCSSKWHTLKKDIKSKKQHIIKSQMELKAMEFRLEYGNST